MSDRIAVVIPVYNHARYIAEALESVLGQTRKPDRVIVIDDGSKDNTLEVLGQFSQRGVEIYAQENQGAHNTINKLIDLASRDCDWISILNSDDRYGRQRLETCLATAQQQPGKSVFCTGLRVMDENGAIVPGDAPRSRWFHGAWSLGQQDGIGIPEWLGQANFVATTSNVFARASYLKAYPFRPYRFNHDYFFLATAALEQQITVIPAPLIDYRVHGSNTISTRPEPLIREMIRMHLDLYRTHATALRGNADMRKRFYGFVRSSWDNISSFHAGMFQVALAQLAAKSTEKELEELASAMHGIEFDEFPNKLLSASYDGINPLSTGGALGRQLEQLKEDHVQAKNDRDALDKLNRFRHKMLRSKWVRLGLILGFVHPLVSNRGKKPHEKMLWLRDACQCNWWLRIGAAIGSQSSYELRRGEV
jgi:glycosyltransferase involved in cell wall biosynthesis